MREPEMTMDLDDLISALQLAAEDEIDWWTIDLLSASWKALAQLRADLASVRQERESDSAIDNGNLFIFCDFVQGLRGCVRGAGHNGPHALALPPYPQAPVLLAAPSADQEPSK